MSHSTALPQPAVPPKPAVPLGASMAYNYAAAHAAIAAPVAPTTCALLRPGLRMQVRGVDQPGAAPCASTGSARTGVGGAAAPGVSTGAAHMSMAGDVAPCLNARPGVDVAWDHVESARAPAHAGESAFASDSTPTCASDSIPTSGSNSTPTSEPPTGLAALRCAIAYCGGQSALASAIGLSQSHVWSWLNRRSIPAEHCPAIERATDRAVRCEALRPDVDWAYLRAVCEELATVRDEA